jgi:N-acyl-D-aspartate/D-glutamate deacylase
VFFLQQIVVQSDEEALLALMRHPQTAMCFSDTGAHVSQIFDSSIYTHLLAYWVREREALSLEEAIQMITSKPADMWRLRDRGRLAPGMAGDIAVFDADVVAPRMPHVVDDLPGGASSSGPTASRRRSSTVRCSRATENRPKPGRVACFA